MLAVFSLCGCQKKVENVENNKVVINNINDYIANFEAKEIKCSILKENAYFNNNHFVNFNSKDIYYISFSKLFSNGENCKKVFEAENIIIGTRGYGFVDSKNYLYISSPDIFDIINTKEEMNDLRINPTKDMIISETEGHTGTLIYIMDNNQLNLYNYQGNYVVNIGNLQGEKISNIYSSLIKSNKNFYQLKKRVINEEECETYLDISCQYEYYLEKNQILSNSYDDILGYASGEIITKDFKIINNEQMEWDIDNLNKSRK